MLTMLMQGSANGTCATTEVGTSPENTNEKQSSNLVDDLKLTGQLMHRS
jgi:hypothetical protein